jgi:hypothetical protein
VFLGEGRMLEDPDATETNSRSRSSPTMFGSHTRCDMPTKKTLAMPEPNPRL